MSTFMLETTQGWIKSRGLAGPRGRAREWATLGVHPLSWLLSNNRLEEVCGTLTKGTFSSRLLLSNQDKGCTPSVAHSLPLPPGFCSTCLVISSSGARFYNESSFTYHNYINVMISSIFLVISWQWCSPLPHFIQAWHSYFHTLYLSMMFSPSK